MAREGGVEAGVEHLEAVDHRRVRRVDRPAPRRDLQGAERRGAVEVRAVALARSRARARAARRPAAGAPRAAPRQRRRPGRRLAAAPSTSRRSAVRAAARGRAAHRLSGSSARTSRRHRGPPATGRSRPAPRRPAARFSRSTGARNASQASALHRTHAARRSSASSASSSAASASPSAIIHCAHAAQAVELRLPGQPLLRLVALVAARGGVALRLGHLDDVDDRRHVLARARCSAARQVGLAERRVVPAPHAVEVVALARSGGAPEAGEERPRGPLGDLVARWAPRCRSRRPRSRAAWAPAARRPR